MEIFSDAKTSPCLSCATTTNHQSTHYFVSSGEIAHGLVGDTASSMSLYSHTVWPNIPVASSVDLWRLKTALYAQDIHY